MSAINDNCNLRYCIFCIVYENLFKKTKSKSDRQNKITSKEYFIVERLCRKKTKRADYERWFC